MRALTVDDRLAAIAGPPAGMLTGPGSTGRLPGFTATGPRSLYAVYDRLATQSDSWYPIATLGAMEYDPGASGPLIAISNGTAKSDAYLRVSRPTTSAYNNSLQAVMTPNRYATAVWMDLDGTTFGIATLGFGSKSFDLSPAVPMDPQPSLYLSDSAPGYLDNMLAVAYPAHHNDHQRKLIMAKLLSLSLSLS